MSESESDSESLYCSEVMEASPLTNESTGSTGAVSPENSRIALTSCDDNRHSTRALIRKLNEQSIPLSLDGWGEQIGVRKQNWYHAMSIYIKHDFSQASLQLAISLMDRFVRRFRLMYAGSLEEAPLDILFDAAITIAEQMVDDAPEHTLREVYRSPLNGVRRENSDIQMAMQLILRVTDWEVIEWTPASFVPHFLEAVNLGSNDELHGGALSVSTMFVLDEQICAYVHPSGIAALTVVLQAMIELDDASGWVNAEALPAFFQRVIQIVTDVGKMDTHYFVQMADFMLFRCFHGGWHSKFTRACAIKFASLMRSFFEPLPLLEAASIPPKKRTAVRRCRSSRNSTSDEMNTSL